MMIIPRQSDHKNLRRRHKKISLRSSNGNQTPRSTSSSLEPLTVLLQLASRFKNWFSRSSFFF
ncbi:unnamed protein product [Malus baccata var. baccata]